MTSEPPRARGADRLVAEQESAAAAEAARIGGAVPPMVDDPAMAPLYEAGEGEQEGWELAELELVGNASHGDGQGLPARTREGSTSSSTPKRSEFMTWTCSMRCGCARASCRWSRCAAAG
jgi:hypothetical protein